jgi:hypothetical protein
MSIIKIFALRTRDQLSYPGAGAVFIMPSNQLRYLNPPSNRIRERVGEDNKDSKRKSDRCKETEIFQN